MLLLAPTRALAAQIVQDARPLVSARGLDVTAAYGDVGFAAAAYTRDAVHHEHPPQHARHRTARTGSRTRRVSAPRSR